MGGAAPDECHGRLPVRSALAVCCRYSADASVVFADGPFRGARALIARALVKPGAGHVFALPRERRGLFGAGSRAQRTLSRATGPVPARGPEKVSGSFRASRSRIR